MFWVSPWPSDHSFPEGSSTVFYVAGMACALIMSLSTVPKLVWMTLDREPKQLVVQEALLAISCELSYFSQFTLTANMAAAAEGAGIMTLFVLPFKWALTSPW